MYYMRNLIRHILKEETNSVDPKIIKLLKTFIIEYFSKVDWFKDVDFEIGEWSSMLSSKPIPEIKITIYIMDEDDKVRESYFSELMGEIDFIMDMFFPMSKYGKHSAVWTMDVKPL